MRTVDIDGPFLRIKFTAMQQSQFFAILEQVKKLDGRIFEPKTKCWTAPICKESIEILKDAGFEFSSLALMEAEKYESGDNEELPEKVFAQLSKEQLKCLDMERLRPFQVEGIQFAQGRNGNVLIADQMGLGKTCQAIGYLAVNPTFRPALIVCPASLKLNWVNEIKKWGLGRERIQLLSGRKPDGLFKSDIFIINYDILGYNYADEIIGWYEVLSDIDLKVIVSDECFVYDTLIQTNKGMLKIGDIVENKLKVKIYCTNSNGTIDLMPIIHYFKNDRKKRILKIVHEFGEINCTEDHLVWSVTDEKWKRVCEINSGEKLYFLSEEIYNREEREGNSEILQSFLCDISSNVNSRKCRIIKGGKDKKSRYEMSLLQKDIYSDAKANKDKKILFKKMYIKISNAIYRFKGKNAWCRAKEENFYKTKNVLSNGERKATQEKIIFNDERKQSYEKCRDSKEISRDKKKKWNIRFSQISSWWKWSINKTTDIFKAIIERWLGIRICSKYKNEIIHGGESTHLLQNRFSKFREKDSNRNRWGRSQREQSEKEGLYKNKIFRVSRVESIEILELGCSGEDRKNSSYDFVYDIEIKNNHNYFANGVLVHNCQMVSSHKAIRTKAFKRLAKTVNHKIFLSGTPIKNRPSEFFTVLNLLDKKTFSNRWQYLNRYCAPKSNGFSVVFNGLSNEKELYKLIYPLMIRREKKDVLKELPPKQKIIVPMECDPVQLRSYEQANSEFREWVKEAQKSLSIKEHIEGLKQLAYMAKRNSVIKWIRDFLTSGEKLVVGGWHTRVLDDIEKEFGNISVRMDGSTPANKRQEVVDRFQNDNKIQLFIGNLKVAGVGITLTAASATATIELLWGPGDHDQFEDRVHRIGQEADSVLAYYLIAPGTVEEDIIEIIQEKAKMLGQVLDGEQREFVEEDVLKALLGRINK